MWLLTDDIQEFIQKFADTTVPSVKATIMTNSIFYRLLKLQNVQTPFDRLKEFFILYPPNRFRWNNLVVT